MASARTIQRITLVWGLLATVACSPATETTATATSSDSPSTSTSAPATSGTEISIAEDPSAMLERYESALPLFEYDASIDLDTQISDSIETGAVLVQDVTFASPSGARVGATIVTPKGDGPFPALLIVDADNRRDEMDLAEAYAAEFGVLSLMIDPPPARSDDIDRPGLGVYTFTERDHGEQIQFVIDLRRVLDLLEAREDVDSSRIGVRAFGLGAETAAILSGVDGRVRGYNLINLVGGPVTFYGDPGAKDAEFLSLDPEERRQWLTTMEPIEPVYFVGHASPAQLLFQLEGEFFRDNARLLLEVASEPKEVEWVEPGTGFQADCRAADWFARLFDLGDGHLFPECEG